MNKASSHNEMQKSVSSVSSNKSVMQTKKEQQTIPEGYKQTAIGVIPEEWEIERFENFASFKNGLNYSKDEKGHGLKIIGVGDFQNHSSITYEKLEQVNLSSSISSDYLLKNNDLLFVRSNGNKDLVGRALLITNLNEDISHSGFTIRARIKSQCHQAKGH